MRQFLHIELTPGDALALRDLIKPFDSNLPDFAKPVLEGLTKKLYAALIELEHVECINVPLDETEALLVNQKVANEDWEGALPLLRQTWALLFELKHDMPPSVGFTLEDYTSENATVEVENDAGTET